MGTQGWWQQEGKHQGEGSQAKSLVRGAAGGGRVGEDERRRRGTGRLWPLALRAWELGWGLAGGETEGRADHQAARLAADLPGGHCDNQGEVTAARAGQGRGANARCPVGKKVGRPAGGARSYAAVQGLGQPPRRNKISGLG